MPVEAVRHRTGDVLGSLRIRPTRLRSSGEGALDLVGGDVLERQSLRKLARTDENFTISRVR